MEYKDFKNLPRYEAKDEEVLYLLEKRPVRTAVIARELKIKPAAAQYILRKLERKNKVIKRRNGKNVYWGLKSKEE